MGIGTKMTARGRGGTIINVLTAVIFFGLIALALWWVFKTAGQAGEEYTEAMVRTSNKASIIQCQTNMRTIWQNLQMYATANGKFPSSQKELTDWCGNTRLFHCDEPNAPDYVYIAGHTDDMPAVSVLLYEPAPVHDGKCNVLYLGGQMDALPPEELKKAVEMTIAMLKQRTR